MWIPNCLPATYPQCNSAKTDMFGIPVGQTGRCPGIPIRGVVLHCIKVPAAAYFSSRCTLPRDFRRRGRRHHDSMHWLVGRTGSLTCMVSEQDVAWGFGDLTGSSPDECLPLPTWTPLVGLTPNQYDCALIHIGLELPPDSAEYGPCCGTCEKPTPFDFNSVLVRLLAAISRNYSLPLTRQYFELDTNLRNCSEECDCIDMNVLLCGANRYCERPTVFSQEDYPEMPTGETLQWVIGITNTGRVVRVPASSL